MSRDTVSQHQNDEMNMKANLMLIVSFVLPTTEGANETCSDWVGRLIQAMLRFPSKVKRPGSKSLEYVDCGDRMWER